MSASFHRGFPPPTSMNSSRFFALFSAVTIIVSQMAPMAAAAPVPTLEPVTGFTTGPAPSRSAKHANSSTTEHKSFHASQAAALDAWKAEHASDIGSSTYAEDLRAFLVLQGKEHRSFHHWNDDTDAEKAWRAAHPNAVNPFTRSTPATTNSDTVSDMMYSGNYQPILPEHRFEGNRPSSRSLVEQARVRGLFGR